MYNILISVGAGAVVFLLLKLAAALSWWLSLLIALAVLLAAFYALSRYVMQKVMAVSEAASRDLQAQRVEKAIRELKGALPYGKWQIYVTGQLNAQIGMIYYLKRDFSNAFPYLEKSFFKNWVAIGMLAVSYMKRGKRDKMKETFEKAVQWSAKESLLWSLYAYCLAECGDNAKAKEVLERGLKKIPGDEKLKQNLELLGEGKKMKMKGYGDMWLQFHLESIGTIQKQQMAAMGGMRRRVIRK
jgi:tetratricopeptide (TPR) repeat protein